MKTIGVIGQGFVGTAIREGMRHTFQVVTHDKKDPDVIYVWDDDEAEVRVTGFKTETPLETLLGKVDGPIFICLPTPMNGDGSCNTKIVEGVVKQFEKLCEPPLHEERLPGEPMKRTLVIKSTILPGTTERLNQECKYVRVCFNPEFLTEMNANEDFKNQNRIVLGGPHDGTAELKQMYQVAYPKVQTTKTSSTIAEMVKYVTNCFLATKVSFANEIKLLCDKLEIDYDKVVEYATKDNRLGHSHWAVPGPMPASDGSGKLLPGFSGSCFCKDLNALIKLSEELGVDPKVMKATWAQNLFVRPEKDWECLIGRAVSD
jgi:UDPglucose 6-dehydrogenase